MEKINANLLEKIRAAAFPDDLSTAAIRLAVAKNVFAVVASLYFACYLFAAGGLAPGFTGPLAYAGYPAFFLAASALAYELVNYSLRIYAERFLYLRHAALGLISVFFLLSVAVHFRVF